MEIRILWPPKNTYVEWFWQTAALAQVLDDTGNPAQHVDVSFSVAGEALRPGLKSDKFGLVHTRFSAPPGDETNRSKVKLIFSLDRYPNTTDQSVYDIRDPASLDNGIYTNFINPAVDQRAAIHMGDDDFPLIAVTTFFGDRDWPPSGYNFSHFTWTINGVEQPYQPNDDGVIVVPIKGPFPQKLTVTIKEQGLLRHLAASWWIIPVPATTDPGLTIIQPKDGQVLPANVDLTAIVVDRDASGSLVDSETLYWSWENAGDQMALNTPASVKTENGTASTVIRADVADGVTVTADLCVVRADTTGKTCVRGLQFESLLPGSILIDTDGSNVLSSGEEHTLTATYTWEGDRPAQDVYLVWSAEIPRGPGVTFSPSNVTRVENGVSTVSISVPAGLIAEGVKITACADYSL